MISLGKLADVAVQLFALGAKALQAVKRRGKPGPDVELLPDRMAAREFVNKRRESPFKDDI